MTGDLEVIPGPRETRRPECRFERCEGCGALVSTTTADASWPFHERWRRPHVGETFTRAARVHDPDRCRSLRGAG